MAHKYKLPEEMELLKEKVRSTLLPVIPAHSGTSAEKNFLFNAKRTNAGRQLPPYYLCYFLLVDLLKFKNLGQFEKVSWSVPIDYNGTAYLVEHRKFGLGVFAQDPETQESEAGEIVKRIKKAINIAKPFFEWKASEAAKQSHLNVVNHSNRLFDRYCYFSEQYKVLSKEAEDRKDERIREQHGSGYSVSFPAYEIRRNAEWMALSAVDAFFSWTEHIFIHMAILSGKVTTGEDVANLADNEWPVKFKCAIDIETEGTRSYYDQLVTVKRQLRNYMTHGAFGKNGEAFSFHSGAGAVPLLLPHQRGSGRFSFYGDLGFNEKEVVDLIESFISHLWSDEREPFKIYIESSLPLILPMASDGQYISAISSVEDMESLVEHLSWQFDQAANMDW
ncbi:hypothetical protein CHH28_11020 [Bacterioplanes sanyensis]|uniref:Uncharacterized protein n=1 Tax=Bacterioplanes sanyensis TaxID=1249553 RepID=A0A222FQX0_9GAMM|nr:hypothetical protein [Bacterioplanes sanyensis]ASP40904.1 hypothetical protein CHH28_11020 [Bacterioplanes sanyensis]